MTADPYVDPATGVLLNSFRIHSEDRLRKVAADISLARMEQLALHPLPGAYDLPHLRRFHKAIFGDVFPWAGQIRTVQLFKETGFCLPQHIETYAAAEFHKLASENHLRGLEPSQFADRLTYYHAEINEMHPFREGNGRAQRAFLQQLAADAGYILDWSFVGANENLKAAVDAHRGNLSPLREIIGIIVRRNGVERI